MSMRGCTLVSLASKNRPPSNCLSRNYAHGEILDDVLLRTFFPSRAALGCSITCLLKAKFPFRRERGMGGIAVDGINLRQTGIRWDTQGGGGACRMG